MIPQIQVVFFYGFFVSKQHLVTSSVWYTLDQEMCSGRLDWVSQAIEQFWSYVLTQCATDSPLFTHLIFRIIQYVFTAAKRCLFLCCMMQKMKTITLQLIVLLLFVGLVEPATTGMLPIYILIAMRNNQRWISVAIVNQFSLLLEHLAILFNEPLKPEACW